MIIFFMLRDDSNTVKNIWKLSWKKADSELKKLLKKNCVTKAGKAFAGLLFQRFGHKKTFWNAEGFFCKNLLVISPNYLLFFLEELVLLLVLEAVAFLLLVEVFLAEVLQLEDLQLLDNCSIAMAQICSSWPEGQPEFCQI